MSIVDNRVEVPITQARTFLSNGRSGLDASPIRVLSAAVSGTITLLALPLASQILVKIASCFLVGQNVLIVSFMANRRASGNA